MSPVSSGLVAVARGRCWIHDDCLADLELSIACGPNPPDMLVLDADWVVDQGGGFGNGHGGGFGNGYGYGYGGNGNGHGYGNGIGYGGNGYGYGFAGDGAGDGGDGAGGGLVAGGRR